MTTHSALAARRPNRATVWRSTTTLALAGAFLLAAWVLPAPVQAQQTVTLAGLQISIWPEFDRPSSLVILEGQLAPGVPLPAALTVRIPAAAQAPNAVALTATDGSLLQAAYTTAVSGGDIIIKFTASSAAFRVEYYDPALVITGQARSFAFRWKSDFAIGAVGLRVQEPAGAQKVSGQPALTPAGTGEYGLNYDVASLGALPAGGTVSLDLSYTKSGSALSATAVGAVQSGAGAPASTPTQAAAGPTANVPWVIGVVGLGLMAVGGGVLWYTRRAPNPRRRPRANPRGRRQAELNQARPATAKRPAPVAAPAGAPAGTTPGTTPGAPASASKQVAFAALDMAPAGFCTNCGQRHESGDQFCRQCGVAVRE